MGNLWLKIKVWTKVTIAALVAIYLLIFILKNGGERASFWWWFGRTYDGPLLYLVLFTFIIGAVISLLGLMMFRTVRQVKEIRSRGRSERLERDLADMKAKAAMLQTRPPMVGQEPLPPAPPQSEPPGDAAE